MSRSRVERENYLSLLEEKRLRQEAQYLEASLIRFAEAAWPEIDPAAFVAGWHFEAVAEHLELVAKGYIRKLLINLPPRHGKSLLVSVAFPAWVWAQARYASVPPTEEDGVTVKAGYQNLYPIMGPQASFMCLSYSGSLAYDHALLMKRLIESDWYQKRFGRRFQIREDKTAVSKFDTTAGGTRISDGFLGTITGRGADYRIFDDPHNVTKSESEIVREQTVSNYDKALKNRVTDPRTSVEIIVMQRTHERDLSGHVIAHDPEFVHLMLPAEFEPDRHCLTYVGGKPFWADPRTKKDEALWPEVWGPEQLAPFKPAKGRTASEYIWAGQYQQRPAPAGGGVIKREWWNLWGDEADPELLKPENARFRKHPSYTYRVASLDTAYTDKQQNDPCGMHVWGVFNDSRGFPAAMLANAWDEMLLFPDLIAKVLATCRKFHVDVLLVEDKTAGPPLVQTLQTHYLEEEFVVQLVPVNRSSGDKMVRLNSISNLFSAGMIYAPNKVWADRVIDSVTMFPKGQHDEHVDCTTLALRHLRLNGLLETEAEIKQLEIEARRRPDRQIPLYPGA